MYKSGRWVLVVVILLVRLGLWYQRSRPVTDDPRVMAAVRQAFSEEAGFAIPQGFQFERIRVGHTAIVVRPDGQRLAARAVPVGALAQRLYTEVVAGSSDDPGQEQGVREVIQDLQSAYGWDLRPEDQLAALPPGWKLDDTH
jgi:hypothetical protein